jgi:predicted aspartyl protease
MRWVTWATVLVMACQISSESTLGREGSNEISFTLHRGYAIVVRGSVGDLKKLNFLVDTGTVPSVLDRRIAQALHLTGTVEKLDVLTKKLDSEFVVAPKMRLGPLRADAVRVAVRDLSFAEEALGTPIDAMIGFDFLGQSSFTIDYKSRKIVFGPIDPSLTAIPYEAYPGYALVEMKLQQRSLRLLVDTGASDLVLFSSAANEYKDAFENVGTKTWSNMGGEFRVQKVHLTGAYLGPIPWGVQDAFILHDGDSPPAGLDGLLGVASLKARRVGLDPNHRRIGWD